MATIEKISNTTWRISKSFKGKRYRMIMNRKPGKAEAERMIWALIEKEPDKPIYKTFQQAAEDYISVKSALLSPATLHGYISTLKIIPEDFKARPISDITNQAIQKCINDYAEGKKYSTVHYMLTYISIILKYIRPDFKVAVQLPPKQKAEFYVPEDSDVKRILEYLKGDTYELPLWLAAFGLRRSEICAVTTSDLDENNILTVNKAKVLNKDTGTFVVKSTKTANSTRKVPLTPYVAELIRKCPEGEVYSMSPMNINKHLADVQKALGIPHFSLHKMRHYFAATAREVMGDAYVEKMGGWTPGSNIMKKVYDYTKDKQEKEARKALIKKMNRLTG